MNVEDILRPYAIAITEKVPEGLTRDVYAMLKAQFKGNMEQIVEMYKCGNDPDYVRLKFYADGKSRQWWLFVPRHMEITSSGVVFIAPNNFKVLCEWARLKGFSDEDILSMRSNYILAHVNVSSKYATVRRIQLLKGKADVETAKKLIKQLPPIAVLTWGLGWNINWELIRLNLVRFTANVKLFGDGIIPTIQLTKHGTGKSTHAIFCQEVLGYAYVSKIPTVAGLIYDARTGAMGLIGKDGIIFDEFTDIGAIDKHRAQEITNVIKTGIDKGIWTRETAIPRGTSRIIQKYVPFIWYGNFEVEPLNCRQHIAEWFKENCGIRAPDAFVDRFALIDITMSFAPQVASLAHKYVLRANVMRGVLQVVKQIAESKPLDKYYNESKLSGRMKVFSARVRAVFEALLSTDEYQVEFEQKEIDSIVYSNDWGEVNDFIKSYVKEVIG